MSMDQIITDLCRKVSDDVTDRVRQTVQWFDDPSHMMIVAFAASASSLGMAAGFHNATMKRAGDTASPDELVDALWSMLRPMVLKTYGGSDADFRALLASLPSRKAG